jgi:hypothetical protein
MKIENKRRALVFLEMDEIDLYNDGQKNTIGTRSRTIIVMS